MLLKTTRTLCPICSTVLAAEILDDNGQVFMTCTCPSHGTFRNLYWSDTETYRRFDAYDRIGTPVTTAFTEGTSDGCPENCGICTNHRSGTLLANIDVTNRCNLTCDFCFVNARACGFVYEPSFDQIIGMMHMLREQKPVPPPAVQFSGGEPTMRSDLPELVRRAKEIGFSQVQIATNGIRMANNPDYAKELRKAGLSTVYLHFDGVSKETDPFLEKHKQAVEYCREAGLGMVLVPTVIAGKNDHEIGAIIRFAVENIGVVRGVNFQPVAFTGAAREDDIRQERVTIPDLLQRIEDQTDGVIRKDDFYPVPCVVPITDLVEAYTNKPTVHFTAHQHCGAATYVFVTEEGVVPVNRMVDVDSFFNSIQKMADKLREGGSLNKYLTLIEGVKNLHASVKKGERGDATRFWMLIAKALVSQNFDSLREFHMNALFIGTMHFMDRYNYDLARVQRCCIHYATPEGRIIPFCSYNSGKVYREEVWRKYARPLDSDSSREG
jgi:uncharacterized radical SAM superfamily Fe-S cluster-containing enzyme